MYHAVALKNTTASGSYLPSQCRIKMVGRGRRTRRVELVGQLRPRSAAVIRKY